MSNARKLQTEIDRTMKKVDEGVELFDEIWEKLYSAEQSNQKEKYEGELKKEIKKLQRLRDTIKSWISGTEVKDKDPLLEARKLIETKMEAFKTCEKEMKTKTYSKEGLAKAEQLSPEEEAKQRTNEWISDCVDRLTTLVQDEEVEVERLQAGKGKKTNKNLIDERKHFIKMHKFHLQKLEGIMRLVTNDVLEVDIVDPLKDDLEYYLDSYNDEDYVQAYDEDFFYESLGLENLDIVNVDRVTTIDTSDSVKSKKGDDDVESKNSKGSSKDTRKSKKSTASSGMIPLTIGRARASKSGVTETPTMTVTTKTTTRGPSLSRDSSHGTSDGDDNSTGMNTPSKKKVPEPTTIPAAQKPAGAPPGASMAAILKREAEQQEKERQAKAAEQLRQQQAQQQAALRQQQEAQLRQQLQQQEAAALRQRQEAAAKQKALQEQQQQQQAALRQQQEAQLRQQQAAQQQQQDTTSSSSGVSGVTVGGPSSSASVTSGTSAGGVVMDIMSGLNGLNLGTPGSGGTGTAIGGIDFVATAAAAGNSNGMIQESFATIPTASDQDRHRTYTPQNPYPGTPPSYPSTPSALFDNPAVYEKLGTDALFFIFYYKQGTYQQYLAARELKKQSWRFHKKYMTWFQRHEEPKVTTDEYEQGTYVYFDYETGWCTRIKQDFRFEYSFLEDSLQ